MVSLLKSFYGDKATEENELGYQYLPKWDIFYDPFRFMDMMSHGKINGFICQGYNPVSSYPDKNRVVHALSQLKFFVVLDPTETATSNSGKIMVK